MSTQRKVPATMVTQHPDNANSPYWHNDPYVSTRYETEEAFRSFSELGATEYKWDWEGKFVDESVIERLFSHNAEYFKKHTLGKDVFLTFRLPNPKVETEFRIGRAFINIMGNASLARHFGLHTPPLFEVILPMTETAEEILAIQEAFQELHSLKHPLYRFNNLVDELLVIPLFEQVSVIMDSYQVLQKYLQLYKNRFKKYPPYLRPYVARSDPALNSGVIPTVLGIKIALSRFEDLSEKTGIEMYPVIGAGSLPFRGGLSPKSVKQFAEAYKGIRTTTLQSAFRYDYPKEDVIKAIEYLEKTLPQQQARRIPAKEEKALRELIPLLEKDYKQEVESIAGVVNEVANFVPKRRERFLHVGLFGYSRGVGKVTLPRAITFTAALYSLGVPPEFVGTGRAISHAKKLGKLDLIEKYFLFLKDDLRRSGRFINKDVLDKLSASSKSWEKISQDIKTIEDYLGESLGPVTDEEEEHQWLTSRVYKSLVNKKSPAEYIEQAAVLRNGLG